ncbi:hypothetical protein ACFL1M_04970, partial [Patescibacteria group bacterium]
GGAAGTDPRYNGGAGGVGRIAVYYDDTISGSSSPSYNIDTLADEHNPYEVVISKEISTDGATSFGNIEWTENLATGTEIQFQTRSGDSTDSTDRTWESWGPTSSSTTLETANTHTNWTGTNATVADGDVTRGIDYYEDEDEGTAGNLTKFTTTAAGGFAEATISSTDISSRDYLTMWVRSSTAGSVITLGIGEAAATEEEQSVNIVQADVWQKVYWDISDITGTSRDGITKLRVTSSENSNVVYIDNLNAQSYLTTPGGSTISSTADNYIQYRAILSTTDVFETPTLSEVRINYNDGSAQVVNDRLANQNWTDEINLDSRLRIITDDLDDIKTDRISKGETGITILGEFDPGSGKDGDVTISSSTDINVSNSIAGRSCSDGGDAVNYNILTLTSNSAVINQAPSDGCLASGDEILLINLQGSSSSYNNVGNYETLFIDYVDRDTIYFTKSKTKYYGDNLDDDSNLGVAAGTQRVMLQRVPHYNNLTVNTGINFYPSDWDGSKGGVMFFRAKEHIAINGTLHANSKGYRGGASISSYNVAVPSGEAFCDLDGGGDGGYQTSQVGANGLCGGGGGGGATSGSYSGGTGTATLGGGGGGGGSAADGDGSHAAGGGGGGYGAAGNGGQSGVNSGSNGGTNSSGNGGNGSDVGGTTYSGGGGGGGTYGDTNLDQLFMGSGGAAGGVANSTVSSGAGGDGGGIVYIAANSIAVNGTLSTDGGDGGNGVNTTWDPGAGGGGAGGSVKMIGNQVGMGNTNSSGDYKTRAYGGTRGTTPAYDGGDGGVGRIAVYSPSSSGTSYPAAQVADIPSYNYSVFVSDEIPTANATE